MDKKIENKKLNKFAELFSSERLSKYYATIERPENIKKIKIATFATVLIFVALAVIIPKPEEYAIEPLEKLPFFYSIFGFLACIGIVAVSKTIGHFLLERKEDYYDN